MKAELSRDGKLTVYPESALETYALGKWQADFQAGLTDSTLTVALEEQPCDLPKIADLKGGPS